VADLAPRTWRPTPQISNTFRRRLLIYRGEGGFELAIMMDTLYNEFHHPSSLDPPRMPPQSSAPFSRVNCVQKKYSRVWTKNS